MRRALLVLLLLAVGAGRAAADQITITGGFLFAAGYGVVSPESIVTGTDGFRISTQVAVGVGSGALGPVSLCGTGSDCQPGVELHVGGFLDASGGGLSRTQVSWRGRDYDMVGFDPALSLHPFGMVTLPEFGDLREVTLTTPFRMTGVFSELQLSQLTPIAGRGIATIRLVRDFDVPRWTDGSVRYDFEAPAAVPEPASMLLFGSGLAGLVAFRRRRCNRVTNEVPQ
jgi:hypothetical protein